MLWHEFIFSKNRSKRLQRHFAFWLAWLLYLSFCEYLYQWPIAGFNLKPFYVNVGPLPFLKTFLLILVYSFVFYIIIYSLQHFVKKNWLKAILLSLPVAGLLYLVVYFLFWNIFPVIDSLAELSNTKKYAAKFWPAFTFGLITPVKIFSSAAIIKYVKYWWLKQKESENLEREKINAELQLLKAQIQPGILFTALNNIYDYSKNASPRAPELLLKLSDLLSYMLYECEQTFVPLEKELEMMKGYIAMEKLRRNDNIEIEVNVKNDLGSKMIAPFLLLPFIENSFKYSGVNTEQAWINMDISIEENSFIMKLANSVAPEDKEDEHLSANSLVNVQKRLSLLYPQQHELRINREQEMLIVFLKIQLNDLNFGAGEKDEESATIESFVKQPTMYAAQ